MPLPPNNVFSLLAYLLALPMLGIAVKWPNLVPTVPGNKSEKCPNNTTFIKAVA